MTYKNIVVCCDGTWCGDECGTKGNIKILADSFAGKPAPEDRPVVVNQKTIVRYFPGLGVQAATVVDYTADGALACTIKARCVEAYRFIVEHFGEGSKVWLFGLSRGAHTVRSVVGMINNLGILRVDQFPPDLPVDVQCACGQVYDIFRNRDKIYHPDQPWSNTFRQNNSWITREPPIIFLGLLDTVGALGVPKLDPGVHVSYEFYDELVSSEVEHVYQALAIHDRCAFFTPCFVRRNPDPNFKPRYSGPHAPKAVVERWFPGAHYDLGRQRFVFGRRQRGLEGLLRGALEYTNFLGLNITYTHELSNPPLQFLIEAVQGVDPSILPKDANTYLPLATADPLPFSWVRVRPWGNTNAYDRIVSSAWAVWASSWLPGNESLKLFLSEAVLSDRQIPLHGVYTPQHFSGFNAQNDDWRQQLRAAPAKGQKSLAFDVWEALNIPAQPAADKQANETDRAAPFMPATPIK